MISYIEALEALSQEGTMIRAGTRLRLTQSAVSKRIQALEDQLNQPLIEKRGRRVALTPQAVQFLEKTRPLLAELRSAVKADKGESFGLLSLGISESVISSWGAKIIAKTMRQLPDVTIELHTHRSPVVIDRVRSGEYLLGVCAGNADAAMDLKTEVMLLEPMVIIPAGLVPLPKRGRSLEFLDVITIEEHSATWEAIARRARKLKISPVQRLESFFAVAQAGIAGLGHALVPYGVAKALRIPPASLVSFRDNELARPITLVSRTSTFGRPFVRKVWEEMKREGERLSDRWATLR